MINLNEICKNAKKIAIGGHVRPDGDCVGSTLGLYNYLKKTTDAQITLFLETPSDTFSYLKGFSEIVSDTSSNEQFDVFFALDASDKERLGEFAKYFDQAGMTVNIDHHISNQGFAKASEIVPEASSTCELVYGLLEKDQIDVEMAKALYTGIIHDTGVLQYSNTSKKTLNIVGELIEFGFDFSTIIDETFYTKTYVQNQILGRAVLESILFMDGRCIASVVDQKMMDFYNAGPKDLEGIVNQLRVTKGVDCAIFLYEISPMEFKVSMRSNDKVDVAAICAMFGGGGHKKAAGCSMNGTFHDVINNISIHIEKQLEQAE